MYEALIMSVQINPLTGPLRAETRKVHQSYFGDRKVVIGRIKLDGNYPDGGLQVENRFVGMRTVDFFLSEVGAYSLLYNSVLKVFKAGAELKPGSAFSIDQRYIAVGT